MPPSVTVSLLARNPLAMSERYSSGRLSRIMAGETALIWALARETDHPGLRRPINGEPPGSAGGDAFRYIQ